MRTLYSLLVTVFFTTAVLGQPVIIYVSPTGATTGPGSSANPASLSYGLSLAQADTMVKEIHMANGTYNTSVAIQLQNHLTIDGGYDVNNWTKTGTPATIILRDSLNALSAPDFALVGFEGIGKYDFVIRDIRLEVDSATDLSTSVYGIHLMNCSGYQIIGCTIYTGEGASGAQGIPGLPGAAGSPGSPGMPGASEPGPVTGGEGGGVAINASNRGGNGSSANSFAVVTPGQLGHGSCGGTGGASGTGPACTAGCFNGPPSCNLVLPGISGVNAVCPGAAGVSGASGGAGNCSNNGYYIGGKGTTGTDGQDGSGGGGGGAGGGRQKNGPDDWGGAGGGGGQGGYAGHGGEGGLAGGSSFCIFICNGGDSANVLNCHLYPSTGGAGGPGGAGGAGGPGGAGGAGGAADTCANGTGGAGGMGSSGGNGGTGGNGAVGLSMPLYVCPGVVGINYARENPDFEIFPNPIQDRLFCRVNSRLQKATIEIFSMDGILLNHLPVETGATVELNVSALPSGIYLLVLNNGPERQVKKFAKL
jgi:hypothetical protein